MNSKDRIEVSKEIEQRGLSFGTPPARVSYEGALLDLYDRTITYEEFQKKVKRLEEVNTDWFDIISGPLFHKNIMFLFQVLTIR